MNDIPKNAGHANESYRFVQLSDLHLSNIGMPNPLRLMNKRFFGYLSWLKKRRRVHQQWVLDSALKSIKHLGVDHYAITGDFTHIGLKHEFAQVALWLSKVGDPKDVTIIPGNHDLYVNEQWDRSFALWEKYMTGDSQYHHSLNPNNEDALEQLNDLYPVVRIRKHIAFIGISSIFDAPYFRATGKVSQKQLDRLENVLKNPGLNSYCKVLLIHHPITLTNTAKRKSLLNYTMLSEIIQEHPVQLILHGHGHKTFIESLNCHNNTQTPVIGISSSSSISQRSNYKAEFILFEILKNESHWEIQSQHHTLNLNKKTFIPTMTKIFKVNL